MLGRMAACLLAAVLAMGPVDVWAKRLAGGQSAGKQSVQVAQRGTGEAAPVQAPAPAAQARTPDTSPTSAGTARPGRGLLGGLAAGLGLAWLASALGFGDGFAQVLLVVLAAAVLLAGLGLVLRRRQANGLALQAASGQSQFDPVIPQGYSPKNVGNDASARPWESTYETPPAASPLGGAQGWGVPDDFDVEGFLKLSKTHFVNLQAAWDRADMASLRAMMTDEMLAQIQHQLAEREQHARGQPNVTEVVMIEAVLLGIEELDDAYLASVEFSGLIREDASAGPNPFREVWNITRPLRGEGGWLVAGVQALQ